jgi:hypothetical protein
MEQLTYTEKWYQAAHCILDAVILNDTYPHKALTAFVDGLALLRCGAKPRLVEEYLKTSVLPELLTRFDAGRGFKPGEISVLGPIDFQRSYKSDFTSLIYRRLTERNGCLKDKNIIINLETITTSEKPNDRK